MINLSQKYTLLISLVYLSVAAQAQDKKDTPSTPGTSTGNTTLTEEIEVVRPYKPVLADAVKIRRNPDMDNTKPFKPALSYSIVDKKLELNSNIKELQAQKMQDEQVRVLSNNYVKIGAGNFNTANGEVYLNNGQDQALQTGAYFKHLSQQGSLDKQQFSNQALGVFGRSLNDTYSLSGKLSYDRRSTFFYGFDPASSIPVDKSKQRFSIIEANGEIASNYSESSDFDYTAGIKLYQFSNINSARESSVLLNTQISKKISQAYLGLNASADITSSKDIAYKLGNHLLRANPYVRLKSNNYDIHIGANIVQEFGTSGRLNIFPALSIDFPVIPEYAVLFGGLNGDVLKTSLKELSSENPYINKNLSIKNSVEKMNVYAGIKGNTGAPFGYKIMAYYKTLEDMQFFVNNQTEVNRFDVIYDNGKSTVFGIEGELNVKATDVLNIGGKAQIFKYDLASEADAWFKPTFRVSSNATLQVNKKVFLDAELLLQAETPTRIEGPAGSFAIGSLKSFMDLSAGAEYKVNDKIGMYLRANNLTAQTYQRYLYYPKMGLTIFGGLNYSF
jgi:hypothetical protein